MTNEGDLFFVEKRGQVWACWLEGRPAVSLGPLGAVLAAMDEFLAEAGHDAALPEPQPQPRGETPHDPQTSLRRQPATPPPVDTQEPDPPASRSQGNRVRDERREERHEITIPGSIRTAQMQNDVILRDLSTNGCRFVERGSYLKRGQYLTIKIGEIGPIEAEVMWREGSFVGVSFPNPLHSSVLDHILNMVPPIEGG